MWHRMSACRNVSWSALYSGRSVRHVLYHVLRYPVHILFGRLVWRCVEIQATVYVQKTASHTPQLRAFLIGVIVFRPDQMDHFLDTNLSTAKAECQIHDSREKRNEALTSADGNS
jgi:hypothetical protein